MSADDHRTTDPTPDRPAGLVDFAALGRRLRRAVTVMGCIGAVLALGDALLNGLSIGRLAVWAFVLVVGIVVADTAFVAVHALRGADRAQRRGERLSSDDVGLLPTRRSSG